MALGTTALKQAIIARDVRIRELEQEVEHLRRQVEQAQADAARADTRPPMPFYGPRPGCYR